MKCPHPLSDHYTVDLCGGCPHLHLTFYDEDDNVLCEAVLTAEQLRTAADFADQLPERSIN